MGIPDTRFTRLVYLRVHLKSFQSKFKTKYSSLAGGVGHSIGWINGLEGVF